MSHFAFHRMAAATMLLLTAALVAPAEAQSTIRVTIGGGSHAGTYELKDGQCDALDGSIISMFTPELAGVAAGPKHLESIEVYTMPGNGKPDGFAVNADFRAKSGQRIVYEIYAVPPELQGPMRIKPFSGRGTVTIKKSETSTSATFRGQTKDGVRMDGSVECVKRR